MESGPVPIGIRELAELYARNAREVIKLIEDRLRRDPVLDIGAYHAYRSALIILAMYEDGRLVKELERLAREFGGCVSCAFSRPVPPSVSLGASVSLTARACALGLRQGECGRYRRIGG